MKFFQNKKLDSIEKRIKSKSKLKRYLEFFVGCSILAICFNLFLSPNDLQRFSIQISAIFLYPFFIVWKRIVILQGKIL